MTRLVVSYDVFDTVVTRSFAHPRDLFVHLGTLLRDRGAVQLEPMAFARERWAAEIAARRASPWTEVVLDDIYRVLAARLGWEPGLAAAARALELEVEARHLRAVPQQPARLQRVRREHGPIVFLSDMYLPSAVLRPWLEREGVCEPGDLLLISGETRGNKSSGQLFMTARRETGGSFDQWRHTGDHPYADVASPQKLGIAACHFTAAHLTRREQAARGTTEEFAPPWRSLLAGAMRLARLEHAATTDRDAVLWETGATVAGPLFYGFVRWVLAEAERRGLRRLYFLARDGQIFWRIAQAIQQATPGPVECRYLYASRLAFSGPVELTAPEALRRLAMPEAQFHSLRQSLVQLGLDEAWAARELPAEFARLDPDANLSRDTREQLSDWLLAPGRRATITAAIAERAARARGYLASVGLLAGAPVGLVDTGWLGTIHQNIERIIGDRGTPSPLTGFYLGLMPAQSTAAAGELVGYTNHHGPLPLLLDESHKVLIELLAQSDHGQVTGFQSGTAGFAPVLNDAGPVNLEEIRLVQQAVLTFTRRMIETAGAATPPEPEFAQAVINLYRNLHDHPTPREVRILGFLPHADQLFEQNHATLCQKMSVWDSGLALVDYHRRPPHWWMQGQAALGSAWLLRTFHAMKRVWWRLQGRHL